MFMSTSELAIKMMNMTMIMIIMVVVMMMVVMMMMMMMVMRMKGINLGSRSWLRPVTLAGEAEGGGAIFDPVCNQGSL